MTAVDKICDLEAEESELLFDPAVAAETVSLTTAGQLPRLPANLPDGVIDAHLDVELGPQHLTTVGKTGVKVELAVYCESVQHG
jgi:hypothetical protein